MLTKVDGRSRRCAESLMKVLLAHGKFNEGLADAQKSDNRSR